MAFQWSDIKTLVEANLGKDGDDNVGILLPLWAKMFQQKVTQDRNYWFLRQSGTLAVDSSAQSYALPTGYSEGMTLYIIGTDPKGYVELKPLYNRQEVIRIYDPVIASTDKREPIHFLVNVTEFELWPWPDAAYTLGADFWGDMSIPDGEDEFTNYLITYFPHLYVNHLTMQGFKYLQEMEDATYYKVLVDEEVRDLRARHVARVLGSDFTLRPRTDVYGDNASERGNAWVNYFWGG